MLTSCPECGSKNILVNSTVSPLDKLQIIQKIKRIVNSICKPRGGTVYWKCRDCHKEGCIIIN
jgi:hypothetical protein